MKEERSNEIKVGITVIGGVVLVLLGFSIFKEWSLASGNPVLLMRFEHSAGLQVGDPVSINGVKAGKVLAVNLDGAGVLVQAEIQKQYVVTQGAVPTIQMLELMGGKKIEIRQGSGATPLDPSMELRGFVDPDIAGALTLLGSLQSKVDSLIFKGSALLDNANAIVGDAELVSAMKETVGHLRAISG